MVYGIFRSKEKLRLSPEFTYYILRYFSYAFHRIETSMNFSRYSYGSGKSTARLPMETREKWMMIPTCACIHVCIYTHSAAPLTRQSVDLYSAYLAITYESAANDTDVNL